MTRPAIFSPAGGAPNLAPLWLVFGLSAAAVALALLTQHRFDMQPCPWCILQRVLFIVIAVVALAAALVARLAPGAARGAALGGALGVDLLASAGIAAALFQHFVAAKSNSCAMTFADRVISGAGLDRLWPDVFEVRATCAEAAISVLGIPFEFYSLALYAVLMALAARVLLGALRRG